MARATTASKEAAEQRVIDLSRCKIKKTISGWSMTQVFGMRCAEGPVGRQLVWSSGKGYSTPIVAYDPVSKRVICHNGHVYALSNINKLWARQADNKVLCGIVGFPQDGDNAALSPEEKTVNPNATVEEMVQASEAEESEYKPFIHCLDTSAGDRLAHYLTDVGVMYT